LGGYFRHAPAAPMAVRAAPPGYQRAGARRLAARPAYLKMRPPAAAHIIPLVTKGVSYWHRRMDRCRPDRGIARQYAAPRQKITGPYFHLPDLLHRGAEVTVVELKDIQLSDTMKRAMARQAEAERESAPRSSTPRGNPWPPPRWARPPTS
jgi:hypothetical protein